MSIDQLSQILDEIKGYVDDYKITKEENEQLKTLITSLQEQTNLNLVKAQEIVNELKEVINA